MIKKKLISLLLFVFCIASIANAQMQMLLHASTELSILDAVPDPIFAFALINLSEEYTDPVVRVRRSSDNAEADFTAEEVIDGTLLAFTGAGSGFVRTLYGQDNVGVNASNTTTFTQPRIVNAGVLEVNESGQPCIYFDGNGDRLDFTTPYAVADSFISLFSVYSLTAAGVGPTLLGSSPTNRGIVLDHSASNWSLDTYRVGGNNTPNAASSYTTNTTYLRSDLVSRTYQRSYINSSITINSGTSNSDFLSATSMLICNAGIGGTTGALPGRVVMMVGYNRDLDGSRIYLESLINRVFGFF